MRKIFTLSPLHTQYLAFAGVRIVPTLDEQWTWLPPGEDSRFEGEPIGPWPQREMAIADALECFDFYFLIMHGAAPEMREYDPVLYDSIRLPELEASLLGGGA